MNRARIVLLVAAAVLAMPNHAFAQKKGGKKPAAAKPVPAAPAAPAAAPADNNVEIDADAPAGAPGAAPAGDGAPAAGEAGATGEGGGEAGGLGDICSIDPSACPKIDMAEAAKRPMAEQMYAVQQIYALRNQRFELQPTWNTSLNDQFVTHTGPTVALNYYITNVLAVGLNGSYYFNNDSQFNFETRRAARVAVPLTEYQWAAALNFTYVPMYGKFAGFGDFIFHYDWYVVGGVGAISTRPIPIVDPTNRNFDYSTKIAFNAGLGLRIFFNRWFAAVLEVRDYVFNDKIENTKLNSELDNPTDKSQWYFPSPKLTNAVQAQLGISIFLPFSWEYRLPK